MDDGRECPNTHNIKDSSDFLPKLKTTKLLAYKGACQLACHGRHGQSKAEKTLQLCQSEKARHPVAALPPPHVSSLRVHLSRTGELPERKPPPAKLMNFYYGFLLQWHFKVWRYINRSFLFQKKTSQEHSRLQEIH